jgi:class 3 adenylate cyclase
MSFAFLDPVGTLIVAAQDPALYVLLLAYTFTVFDTAAAHYRLAKVKTIGDGFFAVGGLPRDEEGAGDGGGGEADDLGAAPQGSAHVLDIVSFACVVLKLMHAASHRHFPERLAEFTGFAFVRHSVAMRGLLFPPLRAAVHVGNARVGVTTTATGAPTVDCFGPDVGLARRLEETSVAGVVSLSGTTRRFLLPLNRGEKFVLSPVTRKLVRGYGTINACTIVSSRVSAPAAVLARLCADDAVKRRHFSGGAWGDKADAESNSSDAGDFQSVLSASDMASDMATSLLPDLLDQSLIGDDEDGNSSDHEAPA